MKRLGDLMVLTRRNLVHIAREPLQLFDVTSRPEPAELREALQRLSEDYAGRGIELKETGAGWRYIAPGLANGAPDHRRRIDYNARRPP